MMKRAGAIGSVAGRGGRLGALSGAALAALCLAVLILEGLEGAPAWAVQEFPSNPAHRGVVSFDPYQIFPENRAGNGVYLQERLLLSLPGETIRHVLALPKPGRFAYLAVDAQGKARVGVFLQPQDKSNRLSEAGQGIFQAVVTLDGVVYKKLFRVMEGRTVVDLLPGSKTADGLTPGERGSVFYHVNAVVEPDPNAGNLEKQFGMQLHLVLYDEEQVRHYEFPIFNSLPQLTLAWMDPEHLTYRLEDGRREVLSLSQFQ